MRSLLLAAVGGVCLFALPALAASPFDGTWKVDFKSGTFDQKPDIMILQDGMFDCQTCAPPYKMLADGKVHKVAGRDYADAMLIGVVDASTVKSESYKDGKKYAEQTRKVSADGAMMTVNWSSSYAADGKTRTGTTVLKRTGPGPVGAHAVSGSWVPEVTEATAMNAPDAGIFTISIDGDSVKYKSMTGESYTAQFGGPAVPVVGDRAGQTVSVRRISDTVIEETNYVKGTATSVNTITLADPKTVKISSKDLRAGFVDELLARKQ